MKQNRTKHLSPLALGIVLCTYQILQAPVAYSASLGSATASNDLLAPVVPEVPTTSAGLSNCGLPATGGGATQPNSSMQNSPTGTSSTLAAPTAALASSATVANVPELGGAMPTSSDASPTLIAQLPLDDCCEIGGNATCEIAGAPPQGGGAIAPLSPLLGLLGLPLLAIPLIPGGNDTPPQVSEPTSTAALAAGVGLLGLWVGRRRFRAATSKVSI